MPSYIHASGWCRLPARCAIGPDSSSINADLQDVDLARGHVANAGATAACALSVWNLHRAEQSSGDPAGR